MITGHGREQATRIAEDGAHLAHDAEEVAVALVALCVVRALALLKVELVVPQHKALHEHAQGGLSRSRCEGRASCSGRSGCAALVNAPSHQVHLEHHRDEGGHGHWRQKHAGSNEQVRVAASSRSIEASVAENCANPQRYTWVGSVE